MPTQIGDKIVSGFGGGSGTIGCFLKGAFFEINNCVVAITAAHVLFNLNTDFSAKASSRETPTATDEQPEAKTANPNSEKADLLLSQQEGNLKTRDDVCRWVRNDAAYKDAAAVAHKNLIVKSSHPRTALMKPTMDPKGFAIPYTKRVHSETDWGLAIVTQFGSYENVPKAVPRAVVGQWTG
jgi:hypothetical protein